MYFQIKTLICIWTNKTFLMRTFVSALRSVCLSVYVFVYLCVCPDDFSSNKQWTEATKRSFKSLLNLVGPNGRSLILRSMLITNKQQPSQTTSQVSTKLEKFEKKMWTDAHMSNDNGSLFQFLWI